VIDAMVERPVNTLSVYAALACTAVLALVLGLGGLGALGLAIATAAGFGLLGALTFRFLWQRLRFGGAHIHAVSAVVLNLTVALATLLLRSALPAGLGAAWMLIVGACLSAVFLLLYLLALRRLEVRWLVEIEVRLRHRRESGPAR
jgi:hypothetical protein